MSEQAIRERAVLLQHDGQIVTLQGQYAVEDIGPYGVIHELPDGRMVQVSRVVVLRLEDGTRVRLWVRPDREMRRLNGAEVQAVGKLVMPGPPPPSYMAAPEQAPSLIDITDITATQPQ